MNHSPHEPAEGFGSHPQSPLDPSLEEIPSEWSESEFRGAYGLTQKQVDRLREIIRREFGVEYTNEQAWGRAIELIALARALVETDPPEERPK